jgi:Tfp pilus assembly protein FimV
LLEKQEEFETKLNVPVIAEEIKEIPTPVKPKANIAEKVTVEEKDLDEDDELSQFDEDDDDLGYGNSPKTSGNKSI